MTVKQLFIMLESIDSGAIENWKPVTSAETGGQEYAQKLDFLRHFEKSRIECVKMGLMQGKQSYQQAEADLFEIGSSKKDLYERQ